MPTRSGLPEIATFKSASGQFTIPPQYWNGNFELEGTLYADRAEIKLRRWDSGQQTDGEFTISGETFNRCRQLLESTRFPSPPPLISCGGLSNWVRLSAASHDGETASVDGSPINTAEWNQFREEMAARITPQLAPRRQTPKLQEAAVHVKTGSACAERLDPLTNPPSTVKCRLQTMPPTNRKSL